MASHEALRGAAGLFGRPALLDRRAAAGCRSERRRFAPALTPRSALVPNPLFQNWERGPGGEGPAEALVARRADPAMAPPGAPLIYCVAVIEATDVSKRWATTLRT